MNWFILVVLIVVVGYLLDREIYFYEGAHLGPRVQSWLYDRWARKYDAGKRESQLHDDEMLAQPLLEQLGKIPEPLILDFATGTGRLSYTLLNRPEFNGHIIALDLSQGMLEQAAAKIKPLMERRNSRPQVQEGSAGSVEFLRQSSMPLPFPDAAFDAVACLEVLELLPDAQAALEEMSRLLRPGGVLLTSRGTEESGRKAKVKSEAEMTSLLAASGFEDIRVTKWWKLFDRVLARKLALPNERRDTVSDNEGISISRQADTISLTGVLLCSKCNQIAWRQAAQAWRCSNCGHQLSVTNTGILLN